VDQGDSPDCSPTVDTCVTARDIQATGINLRRDEESQGIPQAMNRNVVHLSIGFR
jgi:hypothetical protein